MTNWGVRWCIKLRYSTFTAAGADNTGQKNNFHQPDVIIISRQFNSKRLKHTYLHPKLNMSYREKSIWQFWHMRYALCSLVCSYYQCSLDFQNISFKDWNIEHLKHLAHALKQFALYQPVIIINSGGKSNLDNLEWRFKIHN